MDLVNGYHQAPLDEESRRLTAFITFMGVFEWNRIPMGLKSAPSYFQQIMATEVLQGLIYYILELYLDDILVHAQTEQQLLERLETLFQRLREKGVQLNPEKCILGTEEVEFVGHVISQEGIRIRPKRQEEIVNNTRGIAVIYRNRKFCTRSHSRFQKSR